MTERFAPPPPGANPADVANAVSRTFEINDSLQNFTTEIAAQVSVVAGAFMRLAPRASGMRAVLERPSGDNFSATVCLYLLTSPGSLTLSCVSGLVDGQSSVRFEAGQTRAIILRSDGVSGWATVGENQPGRLLNVTPYSTAGSGTHTLRNDTKTVEADIVGGGGGTGGAQGNGAGTNAATGGAGAGAYNRIRFTAGSRSVAYTVGAAGTAGVGATPTDGVAGGASSVTTPTGTRTAAGGGFSSGFVGTATETTITGGDGGAEPAATESIIRSAGENGGPAYIAPAGAAIFSGVGGNGPWGGGQRGRVPAGGAQAALPGRGPGAGASGAATRNSATDQDGAAGHDGLVVFYEYS